MMWNMVPGGSLLHHEILRVQEARLLERLRIGVVGRECRPAVADGITGLQRVVPVSAVVSHQFRDLSKLREGSRQRSPGKRGAREQAGSRERRNICKRIRERLVAEAWLTAGVIIATVAHGSRNIVHRPRILKVDAPAARVRYVQNATH